MALLSRRATCAFVQVYDAGLLPPRPSELHRPTLLEVIALIERRISNLDRLGPPNAAGYTCVGCKDAELHRLLGAVRELAKREG